MEEIKYNIEFDDMIEKYFKYNLKENNYDLDIFIPENMIIEKNVIINYKNYNYNILYPDNPNLKLNIINEKKVNDKGNICNISRFVNIEHTNKHNILQEEIIKIIILLCVKNIRSIKYKSNTNINIIFFNRIEENEFLIYNLTTNAEKIYRISECIEDEDHDKINLTFKKEIIKYNDKRCKQINNLYELINKN